MQTSLTEVIWRCRIWLRKLRRATEAKWTYRAESNSNPSIAITKPRSNPRTNKTSYPTQSDHEYSNLAIDYEATNPLWRWLARLHRNWCHLTLNHLPQVGSSVFVSWSPPTELIHQSTKHLTKPKIINYITPPPPWFFE